MLTRERRPTETGCLQRKYLIKLGRQLFRPDLGSTPIACKTWSIFGAGSQNRR